MFYLLVKLKILILSVGKTNLKLLKQFLLLLEQSCLIQSGKAYDFCAADNKYRLCVAEETMWVDAFFHVL